MSIAARALIALLVGTALGVTLTVAGKLADKQPRAALDRDARLLNEVIERVRQEYVDPIDDDRLMEAAVRGLVSDLDDHSEFLDEDAFDNIRTGASGKYSGVGLEVTRRDGDIVVVTPFSDSPAARAGIHHGDVIASIDGQEVSGDDLFNAVQRMRGPVGSAVALSVRRSGVDRPLEFNLRRASLAVESVQASLAAPGIGYVRIRQFHERTASELIDAVSELESDNLTPLAGLVVDLRDNPGGLLDAAVDVADLFLDEGVIVSARGRGADAAFEHHASSVSVASETPMVVLVNGASASAAEIVAGALQDHGRAELLGTSTFGKGLVQTVMPLRGGQAIKLTTSRYYTPDGHYIQDRGITPDIVVRNPPDGASDEQLSQALATLGHRRLVQRESQ